MDNVLVTGGTGFVGYWMRFTQPSKIYNIDYLNSREYEVLQWEYGEWDSIIHLANISPARVIEYCKRNHARLLYCSSGIVYHPENNTEYRRNKLNWEKYCLDSGVDVVIARLFTFYGHGLDDGKAIVQFEKASKAGEPIRITGDGKTIRSYMSGAEMGRWLWAILLRGVSGETYDVGDDQPVTILELAHRFSNNVIVENSKPDAMPRYLPVDTEKTKRLLEKGE